MINTLSWSESLYKAKIIACEVEAMEQGIDVEAIRNERRREWNEAEMKLEFNEN